VRLDLVDCRDYLVVGDKVSQPVRVEVGDTDGPGRSLPVFVLQGSPRPVVVAERLVDQAEVKAVKAQLGE
jgi:hypothetical protein